MQTPAIPSGNPATLTPVSIRIWYGDGSIVTVRASQLNRWRTAAITDIQVVLVYYAATYQCWNPQLQQWETFPYRKLYSGDDYYWLAADGIYSGNAGEVPAGLQAGAVKAGRLLLDGQFSAIYDAASRDMVGA